SSRTATTTPTSPTWTGPRCANGCTPLGCASRTKWARRWSFSRPRADACPRACPPSHAAAATATSWPPARGDCDRAMRRTSCRAWPSRRTLTRGASRPGSAAGPPRCTRNSCATPPWRWPRACSATHATNGRGRCSSPDAAAELTSVFWLAATAVALTYACYPLLMALRARLAPRPPVPAPATPTIDIVLVVHDAADLLEAKLRNLLALDYPRARIRINVACDGCSDGTEAVARALAGPRLRVFAFRVRRGKSACIAELLPHLDAELVLFTDVRQRVDPAAARVLAAVLSDRSVGAASGELVLEADTGYGRGIDAYWRFESSLRRV